MIVARRRNGVVKIVKTRKPHKCEICGNIIPKGAKALHVNFYNAWHKWMSYYVHLKFPCIHDWMDAFGITATSDEGKLILKEASKFEG